LAERKARSPDGSGRSAKNSGEKRRSRKVKNDRAIAATLPAEKGGNASREARHKRSNRKSKKDQARKRESKGGGEGSEETGEEGQKKG